MPRSLAVLVAALATLADVAQALSCAEAAATLAPNELSTRCDGLCGTGGAFACVLWSVPLVGCESEASTGSVAKSGAHCVNGVSCAVECLPVAADAAKWTIEWRQASSGRVVLSTQPANTTARPVVAVTSAPIAKVDALELPASVSELYVSRSRVSISMCGASG